VASSRRRAFRAALILLLAAFLLFVTGLFPQNLLQVLVERRLLVAAGPGSRIGSLHVVPAVLRAEITDLVLTAPGYRIEAPRVRLALMPGALIGRRLALRFLEIDSPRIVAIPGATSRSSGPPLRELPVLVYRLAIRDGELRYRATGGRELTLRQVEADGAVGAGGLQLRAAGGTWSGSKPLAIGPIAIRLALSPDLHLELRSLEARTAGSRVQASGDLGRLTAPAPKLHLQAGLDLGELAMLLDEPPSRPYRGIANLQATLGGSIDSPAIQARLSGSSLLAAGWPIEQAEVRVDREAGTTVSKARVRLSAVGGRLDGSASLDGHRLDGTVSVSNLDASRISRAAEIAGPPPSGSVSGRLDIRGDVESDVAVSLDAQGTLSRDGTSATVHSSGKGSIDIATRTADLEWTATADAQRAEGESPLRSAHFDVQGTARGPFPPDVTGDLKAQALVDTTSGSLPIDASGSFSRRGLSIALTLTAQAASGTIESSAAVIGRRVSDLSVHARGLDLAALAKGAGGRLGLEFQAAGPFDSLSGNGTASVDSLTWNGIAAGATTAVLGMRGGDPAIELQALALNAHLEATASLRDRRALGTMTLDQTPLDVLRPLMPEGQDLTGAISGTAEWRLPLGAPRDVEVRGRVEQFGFSTVSLGHVSIRQPFTLEAAARRLNVSDLAVDGEGFTAATRGSLPFDASGPIDLQLDGAGDLAALHLPEGWNASGTVNVDARLRGTRTAPEAFGRVVGRALQLECGSIPPVAADEAGIELTGDRAIVPATTFAIADGTVTVHGEVPLAAMVDTASSKPAVARPMRMQIEWKDIQAGSILHRLRPESVTPVVAPLSGRAELTGALRSLQKLEARIELEGMPISVQDTTARLEPAVFTLRNGRLDTEGVTLATPQAAFQVAGAADLVRGRLDVAGKGRVDLRALSPFLTGTALAGTADADLHLGGTVDKPQPRGRVTLADGSVRMRAFPQPITGIRGRILLDASSARLEDVAAVLGGGALTAAGSARIVGKGLEDVRIEMRGRDVSLRYPEGLRSRLDADLLLAGGASRMTLSGDVGVERGLYDLDVALQQSLTAPVTTAPAESPLLRSIGLDLALRLRNPLQVLTSSARLQVKGEMRLRGDLETPAPFGRLEIPPGGELTLQGRQFDVQGGSLEYQGTWDPALGIEAQKVITPVTTVAGGARDYAVSVSVQGSLERPSLGLSSSPTLSESQIVSLIATGQVETAALGGAAWLAGEQAATLLAGRLSAGLTRGFGALGLDEVRIRPELVARETDPSARFTFGKRLTRDLDAVYSVGLGGAESRFVDLEAALPYRGTATAQRRDDGVFRFGLGQAFGSGTGRQLSPLDERVRLSEVRLEGEVDPETQRRLGVKAGDRASYWELQARADAVRRHLLDAGHIEAEVESRLEGDVATFRVRAGPRYSWRVEGMSDPPDLTPSIRKALFEEEARDRGTERLLEALRNRGHLRASVATRTISDADARTLLFTVDPGPPVAIEGVTFPGASTLSESRLMAAAGGAGGLLDDPVKAMAAIRELYRAEHRLAAHVGPPRTEATPGGLRIVVPVEEGDAARVASVQFIGATLPEDELRRVADMATGHVFREDDVPAALERLRGHYLALGYPAVRVSPRLEASGADLELRFEIAEGERVVVGSVVFSGLARTHRFLIRRVVDIHPGDPVDPRKLTQLEHRLQALGLFASVSVSASRENPATVTITLVERPVLLPSYDVRYGTDSEAQALVDAELPNVFGSGLTFGVRHLRGRHFGQGEPGLDPERTNETRGNVHTPQFFFGALNATLSRREEALPTTFGETAIENHRSTTRLDLQASRPLPNRWSLLYGFHRKHVVFRSFVGDFITHVSGLDLSVLRDTRDSPTDPRRGRFWSLNLEVSPRSLGSDLTFVKGFAKVSLARPLTRSLTWAHGYQVGLAHGFGGQELDCPERFQGGGANTLRGFATFSLGVRDLCSENGGQAAVFVSEELRYRRASGLEGAVFYDAGNVFRHVKDLGFDLRHSVGAGLRWATPVGVLLRLDAGIPLARRSGEKAFQVFFSIGQPF
jgi:outer membrane protein insertion porin family